jgi:hypothetical protein
MHVVTHQRIGVDRALGARGGFAQRIKIGGAIARAGKAGRAGATALHDVQGGVGFFRAGEARHGQDNAARSGGVDPTRAGPGSEG